MRSVQTLEDGLAADERERILAAIERAKRAKSRPEASLDDLEKALAGMEKAARVIGQAMLPRPRTARAPEAEIRPAGLVFLAENEYAGRILSEDEREQTEKVSAVQKIYRLNTAEKLILALKGSREERAILIRDPNHLVAMSVLCSPRITEAEIEAFSGMKNVSDQVLREIGNHREWTKRNAVLKNLVCNPRTPTSLALTLLPRLDSQDTKAIAVDRNLPEGLREHARKAADTHDREH
jgi:hypothetical protein